ncbi:MAG: hypothetical protein HYX51_11015 [Chloroflexi bacterium]|nr:hypothetical protein [Chloroflexota bacterium]
MPTYEQFPRFRRDYQLLSPAHRRLFDRAVAKFVADRRTGRFRKGLRENDLHVVWLRIGSHDIFDDPE